MKRPRLRQLRTELTAMRTARDGIQSLLNREAELEGYGLDREALEHARRTIVLALGRLKAEIDSRAVPQRARKTFPFDRR